MVYEDNYKFATYNYKCPFDQCVWSSNMLKNSNLVPIVEIQVGGNADSFR